MKAMVARAQGVGPKLAMSIVAEGTPEAARGEWERCRAAGARLLARGTEDYPPPLRQERAEIQVSNSRFIATLAPAESVEAARALMQKTAILLPDGRVLVAGNGDSERASDQYSAELYSPPYLFKGTRPVIGSSPSTAGYGKTFFLGTAEPSSVSTANTSSPISGENRRISSSVNSARSRCCSTPKRTALPTISCDSRNGMPFFTR